MRNLTPEKLALLVLPRGGNRYAPLPDLRGDDACGILTVVPCGVLSVAIDEEAAAGEPCAPNASSLVCRLRDAEGHEWWCRADFIFTTHADAMEYLQTATLAQLAELNDQNILEDI